MGKKKSRRRGLNRSPLGSKAAKRVHAKFRSKQKALSAKNKGTTNKTGNLTTKGWGSIISSIFRGRPTYASTMGQVTGNLSKNRPTQKTVNRFLKKNIDLTKMNPSFKVNIDTNRAIQGIKNEKIRGWVNRLAPKWAKKLKINHQMHSPTKLNPGDAGYTPTGTGSIKIDKDTEKYLEWMAKANPTGATISEHKKIYAKHLKDGRHTLEQIMNMNPAETMSYHALIDDSEDIKKKKLEDIYQAELGRASDEAGAKYWLDTHAQGDNVDWDNITRMINASAEGKKFDAKNKLKINSI